MVLDVRLAAPAYPENISLLPVVHSPTPNVFLVLLANPREKQFLFVLEPDFLMRAFVQR